MNWTQVLIDGLITSVLIGGWVSIIIKVNPRYEMKSYPPEIVKSVEPQTPAEKSAFLKMALPMMAVFVAYIIFSLFNTYKNVDEKYLTLFIHSFSAFMIWNVIDLLISDWLIFCKINPEYLIMPGTKGNPAYKDYKFHFIGFLKGIILGSILAALLSGIVYLIFTLTKL